MKRLIISVLAAMALALPAMAESDGSVKPERNYIRQGNARFNDEMYHDALELYEKALIVNPASQTALYNKAVTLNRLSSDDNKGTENDPRAEAAKIFADIARLNTNADLAEKSLYNLGNMAYNDNNFGQAIDYYKGALRINPDNRRTRQNLLFAIRQQQEQEQNQDQQQQDQQQQQQQQQQQDQQEQQQQEQQQQQQEQPMSNNAEQILQSMQNKENATRRKAQEEDQPVRGRRTTDKPW